MSLKYCRLLPKLQLLIPQKTSVIRHFILFYFPYDKYICKSFCFTYVILISFNKLFLKIKDIKAWTWMYAFIFLHCMSLGLQMCDCHSICIRSQQLCDSVNISGLKSAVVRAQARSTRDPRFNFLLHVRLFTTCYMYFTDFIQQSVIEAYL